MFSVIKTAVCLCIKHCYENNYRIIPHVIHSVFVDKFKVRFMSSIYSFILKISVIEHAKEKFTPIHRHSRLNVH